MINITNETINGRDFVKTRSDTYHIQKVGTEEIYTEAWDLPESGYGYAETELLLVEDEAGEGGDAGLWPNEAEGLEPEPDDGGG